MVGRDPVHAALLAVEQAAREVVAADYECLNRARFDLLAALDALDAARKEEAERCHYCYGGGGDPRFLNGGPPNRCGYCDGTGKPCYTCVLREMRK